MRLCLRIYHCRLNSLGDEGVVGLPPMSSLRDANLTISPGNTMLPWSKSCICNSDDRLLYPVIQIYREERWYELLEEALVLGLDCAERLDDQMNAFRFSLELLSDGISFHMRSDHTEFMQPSNHLTFSVPSFASLGLAQSSQTRAKSEFQLNAIDFVSFGMSSFENY